jgi:hypothetical protein
MNARSPIDWENPYQAPQVLLEPEPERDFFPQKSYFWPKLWIWAQMLVVAVGLGLSFVEIETIVGTGPVLAAVGFVVTRRGYRMGSWWTMSLGISGPVFSLFIFLLINVMEWGPGAAERPVAILGTAYLATTAILALMVRLEIRKREPQSHDLPPGSSHP